MPNFPIANNDDVKEISEKIGTSADSANQSGTTGFALWKWLVATWTATRATKIDNLDATVSSRAASADMGTPATAASTTVNTTNPMMAYIKGIVSNVVSLVSSIATINSTVNTIKANQAPNKTIMKTYNLAMTTTAQTETISLVGPGRLLYMTLKINGSYSLSLTWKYILDGVTVVDPGQKSVSTTSGVIAVWFGLLSHYFQNALTYDISSLDLPFQSNAEVSFKYQTNSGTANLTLTLVYAGT